MNVHWFTPDIPAKQCKEARQLFRVQGGLTLRKHNLHSLHDPQLERSPTRTINGMQTSDVIEGVALLSLNLAYRSLSVANSVDRGCEFSGGLERQLFAVIHGSSFEA